jgi:hypothetical protein
MKGTDKTTQILALIGFFTLMLIAGKLISAFVGHFFGLH